MANDETTTNDSVAVLERAEDEPEATAPPVDELAPNADQKKSKKKKKDEEDDLEREIEFVTPFGKIELEFEPTDRRKKKDKERREKAARQAAKAAEKAQQKLAEQRARAEKGGGGGKLLIILLVVGLIGAAIAVAWWLFARPADELDRVPEDLRVRTDPEPQGAFAKIRNRVREGIRAGQKASSETQKEQTRRYEEITGGS
jgi:hypothetical protein